MSDPILILLAFEPKIGSEMRDLVEQLQIVPGALTLIVNLTGARGVLRRHPMTKPVDHVDSDGPPRTEHTEDGPDSVHRLDLASSDSAGVNGGARSTEPSTSAAVTTALLIHTCSKPDAVLPATEPSLNAQPTTTTRAVAERYPPGSSFKSLAALVERIQSGESDGMQELYFLFSKGIRFYLCRQLGSQEVDDKIHDTFIIIVQSIRRGELREPERLMGFVRTIVRRIVAAHVERAVRNRRDRRDVEWGMHIVDPAGNPEEVVGFRQRAELMRNVLNELSHQDRMILTRFYLDEQSQHHVCTEMALTPTQFRLLKSRAKKRFADLGKKKLTPGTLSAISLRT